MPYTDGQGLDYFSGDEPTIDSPIAQGAGWILDLIKFLKDPTAGLMPLLRQFGAPTGMIGAWPASSAPTGWLMCTGATIGSALSGATYAGDDYKNLFEIVKGLAPNNGSENFDENETAVLPDLRRKYILGAGGTVINDTVANTLGADGGEEEVGLEAANNGPHGHQLWCYDGTRRGDIEPWTWNDRDSTAAAAYYHSPQRYLEFGAKADVPIIEHSGSGTPHNNMPPTVVLNYIIKY